MRAKTRAADFLELTKPRITTMVLVTTAIGYLAAGRTLAEARAVACAIGVGLLTAGAGALNHLFEREIDALMHRTANRPLVSGRMAPGTALAYGLVLTVGGLAVLVLAVNPLTAMVGAFAFASYVFAYTPLKRVTSLATIVGAVPGALPPVLGWTAASNALGVGAWVLFSILFLWQLPHFLAISWLYRDDYARAGLPILSVGDPQGRATSRQAVLYGAALLPVSLLPSLTGLTGVPYFFGALAFGLAFLGACVAFLYSVSRRSARRLLLVSVVYLPALLGAMLIDRLV